MEKSAQEKVEQFFSTHPLQRYKKRETIIREGDPFYKIYYLKSGFVRLYSITKNGKEISLNIFTPGDFFPAFLMLSDDVSQYYFETITPIEVRGVLTEKFIEYIKRSPLLLYDIINKGGKMMSSALKHLVLLTSQSSYSNINTILLYFCSVYMPIKSDNGLCYEIPFSHQEIATWTNTTRETVTRQIQKLIKKGIITSRHRHLVISDLHKLEAEIR